MSYKYIMFQIQNKDLKIKFPIIFPDKLVHKDVAQALIIHMRELAGKGSVEVISAGAIGELEVMGTYGESTTLSLKANKNDDVVINNYPYFHGID